MTTIYDYKTAITEDIIDYFKDNPDMIEKGFDEIYDELWTADSVTGNASGSYTFNRWQAGEYVKPNMSLAIEAMTEFGFDMKVLSEKYHDEEWEYLDVTIRCYLLAECLSNILDTMEV